MYKPSIKDDDHFRSELLFLLDFFKKKNQNDQLTEGLVYIKETILDWLFEVVFNHMKFTGDQSKTATTRDIEDLYQDGIDFLNSPEGKRFIDVLHYFANFYKVPDEQKGGYNV